MRQAVRSARLNTYPLEKSVLSETNRRHGLGMNRDQEILSQKHVELTNLHRLFRPCRRALHNHEKVVLIILYFRKLTPRDTILNR